MSDEIVRDYLKKDEPSPLMLLVNPFTRLAGWPALIVGLLVLAATVAVAVFGRIHFDGIVDVHAGMLATARVLAIEPIADWLIVALLFLLAGRLWGPQTQRVADHFAMSAIGRLPFAIVGLMWTERALGHLMAPLLQAALTQQKTPPDFAAIPGLPWLIIGGFVTMAIMAWGLFLNFFALREASGMKTDRAVLAYIGVVVIGEILSKTMALLLLHAA